MFGYVKKNNYIYTKCFDEGGQQARVSLGVLLGLCQQLTLQA